jgi:hypothetical protein
MLSVRLCLILWSLFALPLPWQAEAQTPARRLNPPAAEPAPSAASAAGSVNITAFVFGMERRVSQRTMVIEGSAPHSQCADQRAPIKIEKQCFPEGYRVVSPLFSATTPFALRNSFSADDSTCFTVLGGSIKNVAQNCFEAELLVRECRPRSSEECSWALRNGTPYVASATALRELRVQVGTAATVWHGARAGTYELIVSDFRSETDEYQFSVLISDPGAGRSWTLTNASPQADRFKASIDARWRRLTVEVSPMPQR